MAAVEIILETSVVALRYHPGAKIVHHELRRFVYGDTFRQLLEKGLLLLQQRGAEKWLSDNRYQSALPKEDFDWAQQNWAPRVIAAGMKRWAIVMPEKVVGQMNIRRISQTYIERGVTVRFFTESHEALRWLEEQPL